MSRGHLVHQLEEWAAATHPDRTAVVDGDRSLTYGQLDARANQVAGALTELGVRRGDRVGVYLDKSLEAVVAIYGILKTGAAYVPHDPGAPAPRLAYIEANCGITTLVTATAQQERWPQLVAGGSPVNRLLVLDGEDDPAVDLPRDVTHHGAAAVAAQGTIRPATPTIDLDLAYILYTSGSTGVPKGVQLSHLNARGFVDWAAVEFAVTPDDRLSSHAPLHFDLSVFDLYAAAYAGAAVVLVPAKHSVFPVQLARFIAEQRITVWYSVPSILTMLTTRGGLGPDRWPELRTVLFAGEVFPTKYLRQLMAYLPGVRFANLYGPTETNVCTWYEVSGPLEDDAPIPIGRPIDNVEVFAVEDGRIVGPGEVGELFVRGTTVTQGYWGDPERSARSLVANPRNNLADLVYRTGDLVTIDPDGTIWYLGRRDAQIKSRGYRIELGEIEAALDAHEDVIECAAVAVPDEVFTNRIQAFVVVRHGVDKDDLSKFVAARLPRYMVPELWEFCAELPRTSTGKIDRQALRTPPAGG